MEKEESKTHIDEDTHIPERNPTMEQTAASSEVVTPANEASVTSKPQTKRNPLVIGGIIIALLIVGWFGYSQYQKQLEEKREQEYLVEYQFALTAMLRSGAVAEEMLNGYYKVWNMAFDKSLYALDIAKELNCDVTELSQSGLVSNRGKFNDAIDVVRDYYKSSKRVESIEKSKTIVRDQVKMLNNPPEKFRQSYDQLVQLYGTYEEFINFALSPTGNISSFNQNANRLGTEFMRKYNEIEIRLPKLPKK